MKKFFLLSLFFFIISIPVMANEINGDWYGNLKIGNTQLRLKFNISELNNKITSTMDSLDQGVKDIPVTNISFKDSVLKIEISNANIQYEGVLDKNNIIVGNFKQSGKIFPMNLSKEEIKKKEIIRPQEPVKPYPYYSEDIEFKNNKDGIVLSGTLTLPKKEGLYTTVILISGSGPQNRDEEILGHKPFLVISDYLARNGIAVLRYDDRGFGKSTGDFKLATTEDFAKDVESAISYLRTRKEINKIGLIGHSEGGLIAPMVANNSKDVSFIILLAGPGLQGNEILLLQQKLISKASSIDTNKLEKNENINKNLYNMIINSNDKNSLKEDLHKYMEKLLIDEPLKDNSMNKETFIKSEIDLLTSPWMSYFIKYNPIPALEKIKCPILVLNGEKDLQVPPKENLYAIERALIKGRNKNFTIKELPNLNHLFQEAKTGSPNEYEKIEETFSPIALKEILDWIKYNNL